MSKDTLNGEILSKEEYNRLFLINTISPCLLTNGFINKFPNSRYIFISSISSSLLPYDILNVDFYQYFTSNEFYGINYGLSKYALDIFSKYISDNYGIDSISIDPGFIPSLGMNKLTNTNILKLKQLYFKTTDIDTSINFIMENSVLIKGKLDGKHLNMDYNTIDTYSEYNTISLIKSLKKISSNEGIEFIFDKGKGQEEIFYKMNNDNKYIKQLTSLYPIIASIISLYYIKNKKIKIHILLYIVITWKILDICKKIIKQERPSKSYNSDHFIIYNRKDTTYGCPSLHSYFSFLFSTILW